MNPIQLTVTEFFQFIFEAFKEDKPEFLVVHHRFKVRHALRNLDDATTQEVMAAENAYGAQLNALVANYYKVMAIMGSTPEPLQPAMLKILGSEVATFLTDLGVEPNVLHMIMGQLADVLNDYPEPDEETLAQAGQTLQMILEQVALQESQLDEQQGT